MLTVTTTAMLDDLLDPDNAEVWRAFDARYRPILVGFSRRLGLAPEDAADAAQEALVRFVKAYRSGQYDRARGRLRAWIIGIARHCVIDQQSARRARREHRGLSAVSNLPDDEALATIWDEECDREVLRQALGVLRTSTKTDPRTVTAFEQVAFRDRTAADVAAELEMTPNDVYLAKHRCLKRLRSIVRELSEAYELET